MTDRTTHPAADLATALFYRYGSGKGLQQTPEEWQADAAALRAALQPVEVEQRGLAAAHEALVALYGRCGNHDGASGEAPDCAVIAAALRALPSEQAAGGDGLAALLRKRRGQAANDDYPQGEWDQGYQAAWDEVLREVDSFAPASPPVERVAEHVHSQQECGVMRHVGSQHYLDESCSLAEDDLYHCGPCDCIPPRPPLDQPRLHAPGCASRRAAEAGDRGWGSQRVGIAATQGDHDRRWLLAVIDAALAAPASPPVERVTCECPGVQAGFSFAHVPDCPNREARPFA